MEMPYSIGYPFTAIVGYERIKKALILSVINPHIGGVLICGEEETAKSSAVKALSLLLPDMDTIENCNFNCDPKYKNNVCESCKKNFHAIHYIKIIKKKIPFVEVGISTTEEKLAGSLNLQYTIEGDKYIFSPGDLAKANRGIIYVDNINLLDDNILDILSRTASRGINVLKRGDYIYSHKAQFTLIGSMNAEYGGIKPQLMECFGLCVQALRTFTSFERMEIVKRKKEFKRNPMDFIAKFSDKEKKLKDKIKKAKEKLIYIDISGKVLRLIEKYCVETFISSGRVERVIREVAFSIAAYYEHDDVLEEDVKEAVELVLPSRFRARSNIEDEIFEKCIDEVM